MIKLLITSKTYTPNKNEALTGIVAKECPSFTWKDVAMYNWGTTEPAEVNRALFEVVGCSKIEKDPSKSLLDPDRGTTKQILIPKLWTGDAQWEKLTTIKVRSKTPAPAVSITALDKWFIPRTETCEIGYRLEGSSTYADKVAFEVHGSNYCKASARNNGLGTFTALAATPVYKRAPDKMAADERSSISLSDWKGEADAGDGLLKGDNRLINVAFSPYTVMFRYFKDNGDKDARLLIKPFWPQFDLSAHGTPVVAASLKIEWEISNITRLKNGTLLVVDRDNRVVYRRALPAAKLAQGTQSIDDWNGSYNWDHEGNCVTTRGQVSMDRMPYRVQIQAHTGVGDPKGVALAAMHTEVRLYVHPKTRYASEENYDPAAEPQTFAFTLADTVPLDPPVVARPAAGGSANDKRKYAQFQLAKAGYHPGPVDGNDRPAFQAAIKEFKRSVPKRRAGPEDDFERFTAVNDSVGADELDALEDLPARTLPWFGAAADGGLFGYRKLDDIKDSDAVEDLQDPARLINVWVDDRQYYDKTSNPVDATIDGDPAAMGHQRGTMEIGDNKTVRDAEFIPRPWIPLQVALPLLSRDHNFDYELSVRQRRNSLQPDAIGPLRVDWAFDEAGPDVSVIPDDYKEASVELQIRTKRFLSWTLDDLKESAYQRKDLKRNVDYTNCPGDNGGIRPAAIATYFSKAFGIKNDSLLPWYADEDAARDSVVTVAHSNWGGDHQTADQLFPKVLGTAGVYFHPSNIAGDGYRVRARVRFLDGGGFVFANHPVLAARYLKVPQANTAKLRLWRKTALRGFIRWTASRTGNWPKLAGKDGILKYYNPAHVHVVHVDGVAKAWKVNELFDFSTNDTDAIKDAVAASVTQNFLKNKAKMTIDAEYVWPWVHAPCLGWEEAVPAAVTDAQIFDQFLATDLRNVWRAFRMRVIFELLKRVEKKHGRMKGHLLVEFDDAPKFWVSWCLCNVCNQPFRFLDRTQAGGDASGLPCPNPAGCTGRMTLEAKGADYTGRYVCDKCHVERDKEHDNVNGNDFAGKKCGRGLFSKCDGNLSPVQAYIEEYKCATCSRSASMDEPNSNGGTHVGDACPDATCHGVLQRQNGNWERYVCPAGDPAVVMPVGVLGHASATCSVCGKALAHRPGPVNPDPLTQIGKLSLSPARTYVEEYKCATCNTLVRMAEPNSNGGTHVGGACPNAACHGVLQRQNGDWERYVCPAGDPAVVMPAGVLGHASATCPVCHKALAHRPGPVAPDLVPQAGKLSLGTPPPRPTKRLGPMRSFEGLSVPAVGVVCGATWLFTSGEPIVWAHEMGHHRHMEHAANAPGAKDDQHDHEDNANIAVGGNTTERQWDLRCMMNGYATADHPGREHDFPCGKCVLKNRGWKVEGLGRPAGNITD